MTDQRQQVITDHILKDPFANHLGAEVFIPEPGKSRVHLTITPEMTNFHGMAHGGIIFAVSDIAFAAASNSYGRTAVALNVSINFLSAATAGDRLVAEAEETHATGRTALYNIEIRQETTGTRVAKTQNLVYRKKEWFAAPGAPAAK